MCLKNPVGCVFTHDHAFFHLLLLQLNVSSIQSDEQDSCEACQHAHILYHEEGEVRFPARYLFSQHVIHLWKHVCQRNVKEHASS